ncbi:MAG TPA: DUF3375 family protein [Microbacterium sp.]|nr:DUF3375 family protein [Microbacterium sp.]
MDHDEIDQLYERHGAWRLPRKSNAPLILSFLGTHLIDANRGAVAQSELASLLDDHLYAIHQSAPDRYRSEPVEYLETWAAADDGWLRRFYAPGRGRGRVDREAGITALHSDWGDETCPQVAGYVPRGVRRRS